MSLNKVTDYLEETRDFWKMEDKTLFHNSISATVSQKTNFEESRKIRSNLYNLIGSSDITIQNMNFSDEKLREIGISQEQLTLIRQIICLEKENNLNISNISLLKGVGEWMIKSLKILNYEEDVFLGEDLWIRTRMSEIYGYNRTMTLSLLNTVTKNYKNKSELSRFLWRIKPIGAQKIHRNMVLTKADFL